MIFLSLDLETNGLVPGRHGVASIGAVPVVRHRGAWDVNLTRTFYAELQPQDDMRVEPESVAIHGLDEDYLRANGAPVEEVLIAFRDYMNTLLERYGRVRPAAWPSSIDVPFLSCLSAAFLGEDLIGKSTIDIPSFAMGRLGCTDRRRLQHVMKKAGFNAPENHHKHNALADAIEQAETLAWLLNLRSDQHA